MAYIPNLIPDDFKDESKDNSANEQPSVTKRILSIFRKILGWFFGISMVVGTIVYLQEKKLLLALNALALGIMLIPPTNRFIARKFKIESKPIYKAIIIVLLMATFSFTINQKRIENKKIYAEKTIKERNEKSHKLLDIANYDNMRSKALELVKEGKSEKALLLLDTLLSKDSSSAELLYNRAFCYSKTGKIKEAVADCIKSANMGNKEAEALYNNINPVIKKVIGYTTLCCDGSTSDNRGRGACARHGGVCDWNKPIYEEIRKY